MKKRAQISHYECLNCSIIFEGKTRDKRKFCTKKCANIFSNKNRIISEETKNKISKSLEKPKISLICKYCENKFEIKNNKRNQLFCSISCSSKYRMTDELKEKFRILGKETAFKNHINPNINFGWQSRDKFEPSYPESIAIRYFEENNINFVRELKIGKYFIDFHLVDFGKIAIEIDGQQHSLPDRIKSDIEKDRLLHNNDWLVFRIKYPQDNIRKSLQEIIKTLL